MNPIKFEQSNALYGPPKDLTDSQCSTIYAYNGNVNGGSVDGINIVITAWKPTAQELEALNQGGPVFITMIGGLAPHYISTSFTDATNFA